MAEITLSSGSGIRPYRSPWGAFPTINLTLSTGVSSAAIYLGDPLTLDGSHQVKRSTASSHVQLAGIAAEANSSGSSGTAILAWDVNPMVEFSAYTKGGALTSTMVGATRPIIRDSTLNIWYIPTAATTQADERVLITGFVDSLGDTGGQVSFRFLKDLPPNSTQLSSQAYLAFYAK